MPRSFPKNLSQLRRERCISQRQAAQALGISQALLSHYENGTREPGLGFVCRVCDYYGVTADYLLGRSDCPDAARRAADTAAGLFREMRGLIDSAEAAINEYEEECDKSHS